MTISRLVSAVFCGVLIPTSWTMAETAAVPVQKPEPTTFFVRDLSADPVVAKVRAAALAMQRKSWEQGVLAQAFVELGDQAMVREMACASLMRRNRDGLAAGDGGSPVDPLMVGEALWQAAAGSGDPALREAADTMLEYTLKKAPRAADGTIYHFPGRIWSDSFHTSPPFLALAGHPDEALQQIEGHWRRLWNPETKLVAHIWNEEKKTFDDAKAWGSGNGWAAAALARVIRVWPADRSEEKARLVAMTRAVLDGCIAHLRPDGLFHDVVNDPTSFVETNLGQMLAFTIYEGVRAGWLPNEYLAPADRMRVAARAKVDANGFVQDVCGAPDFKHAGVSPEGQAFFLMMEAAAAKAGRPAL